MSNEVSDQEIEREIQTLRNLRRRSVTSAGPGALPLDPDLPPPSPNSRSGAAQYHEASTSYTSNDDITLSSSDGLDGDDGLFWVPAHLHPELAPGEFRAFLKSHTHPDPTHADAAEAAEAPGLSRSPSWVTRNPSRRGAEGLGRKRSMLSRQYQPKAGDNVEEERPPLPSRRPASIYGGRTGEKGLTLEDLQKLEMLVDEAGEDDDPGHMRNLLRRSLSLNVAPGLLQDDVPQGHDSDAPLLAPRPGSILRRSAHTKIRKASLAGDGGGHRFAATRKGRMTAAPQVEIPGLEDDDVVSSSGSPLRGTSDENASAEEDKFHDAQDQDGPQHYEVRRNSDESTDETNIFDAYARDSHSSSVSSSSHDHSRSPSPEPSPPGRKLELPSVVTGASLGDASDWFTTPDNGRTPPTLEARADPLLGQRRVSPGLEASDRPSVPSMTAGIGGLSLDVSGQGQGQGAGAAEAAAGQPPSPSMSQPPPRTGTGAGTLPPAGQPELLPGMAPPAQRPPLTSSAPVQSGMTTPVGLEKPALARVDTGLSSSSKESREKEKKGGFFSKKDKDKDKKKKDKDRFLGSLFGGKKKQDENAQVANVSNFSSDGRAAAAALLGSSKSAKSLGVVPPSVSPTSPGFTSFARYPIHVERAVYRLSHIKLANARRPLYEQVLISNLMFWYLGIIGRNVTEEKKANGEEKREEVKMVVKGTPPKPADVGSAARPGGQIVRAITPPVVIVPAPVDPPAQQPVSVLGPPVSTKKASLSKPERARDGRNHEAGVRTPQYGMQNAQVDQEIRSGPGPVLKPLPAQQQPQRPYPLHLPQQGQQQPVPPPGAGYPPHQQQHPQQQHSQQHPQHPQHPQQHPPQQHPQQQGQQGQQRPMSPMSPTSPGRASIEGGYIIPHQVQNPNRGVPQSSFGPPPPGPGPQPVGMDPVRQRTLSNPTHMGHHPQPMPPQGGAPRRVVTDGRVTPDTGGPRSPQHSGPQPGQLFQYPGGGSGPNPNGPASPFPPRPSQSPGPQPGQIFGHPAAHGTQPGQVFRPPPHPQQQYGQRPLPPPGQGHPVHPGGHPGGHPAHPGVGGGWEPPQRLPPGAGPPRAGPTHPQQRPPQGMGMSGGVPGQPFDPRRAIPGSGFSPPPPPPPQAGGYYGGPGQGQGHVRPQQGVPGQTVQGVPGQQYGYQAGYGHHR